MTLTDRQSRKSACRRGAVGVMLCALVLATACSSQSPAASPATSSRPASPPSVSATPSASAAPSVSTRTLADEYLAIARPANHRLDVEFDGFGDQSRDDLAKAAADLRAEAATELHFDLQLSRIPFPPAIGFLAWELIRANQSRIALTRREARSESIAQLRSFASRHKAANAAVEMRVKALRKALHLPPPSTS
jgi:hypothetical protein